jgi:hypothetical protein
MAIRRTCCSTATATPTLERSAAATEADHHNHADTAYAHNDALLDGDHHSPVLEHTSFQQVLV